MVGLSYPRLDSRSRKEEMAGESQCSPNISRKEAVTQISSLQKKNKKDGDKLTPVAQFSSAQSSVFIDRK